MVPTAEGCRCSRSGDRDPGPQPSAGRHVRRSLTIVLRLYQRRYRAVCRNPGVRVVLVFKNHGSIAGASLVHPHSQIVGAPVEPPLLRRRYQIARVHFEEHRTGLYRELREAERRAGERVLFESDGFVAFLPFASRWPYETWILPCTDRFSFGDATDSELAAAGSTLRRTLRLLRSALEDPPLNYVVHSSPVQGAEQPFLLWHIQIVPRLATVSAGFELGSGMMINTAPPERLAEQLRDLVG